MIFLTVGSQLPFDRLIRLVDELAPSIGGEIVAQIGRSPLKAKNFPVFDILTPDVFNETLAKATLIVGHAGVGTILQARRAGKPLIIFPRRASFGEHRNDHQVATASAVKGVPGVRVALDAADLEAALRDPPPRPPPVMQPSATHQQLLDAVRSIIDSA